MMAIIYLFGYKSPQGMDAKIEGYSPTEPW